MTYGQVLRVELALFKPDCTPHGRARQSWLRSEIVRHEQQLAA